MVMCGRVSKRCEIAHAARKLRGPVAGVVPDTQQTPHRRSTAPHGTQIITLNQWSNARQKRHLICIQVRRHDGPLASELLGRPRPAQRRAVPPGGQTNFPTAKSRAPRSGGARLSDSNRAGLAHSGRVSTSRNSWFTNRSSLPTLTSLSRPAATNACSQVEAV